MLLLENKSITQIAHSQKNKTRRNLECIKIESSSYAKAENNLVLLRCKATAWVV